MSLNRRLAALTTVALTATGFGVVAAQPASAADASLDWRISQQFTDHLSDREVTDGATEGKGGVISFPVASTDIESGVGSVSYDGSVAGSFVMLGTTYYTVTLADPVVTVDEDGEGEISAVVSAWNAAAMGNPEDSTEPTRVVVTTFDAEGGWSGGSITATPDWAGVLPPGPESEALGIDEGEPIDGQSFAASFLGQLTGGVRAHFYASGAGSDPKKAPATFTAAAGDTVGVEKQVAATMAYTEKDLTVTVSGTGGFSADEGDVIYIGLAQGRTLPDVSEWDESQFAAAQMIPKASIVGGEFTGTMTAPVAALDPRKSYSVFTWLGHEHTSTSQDTVTPVTINWKKLGTATKLEAAKKGKKLVVTVGKGAQGKVGVVYTQGKAKKSASAPVKAGKASVALPAKPKGAWKAVVTYRPSSATYQTAKKTVTVRR